MADEAAIADDEAASIAELAADEAAIPAVIAESVALAAIDGADAGAGVTTGATTTGSSTFLVQAAKDTAAASETINNAVFIFLLGLKGSNNFSVIVGNPLDKEPQRAKAHEC